MTVQRCLGQQKGFMQEVWVFITSWWDWIGLWLRHLNEEDQLMISKEVLLVSQGFGGIGNFNWEQTKYYNTQASITLHHSINISKVRSET